MLELKFIKSEEKSCQFGSFGQFASRILRVKLKKNSFQG